MKKSIFILAILFTTVVTSCKKDDVEPETLAPVTSIGSYYQGGIVVSLSADGQHGLIITDFDVDTCEWSNGPMTYATLSYNDYYNAYGMQDSDVGAGKYNTQLIVNTFGSNGINYAAKVCADLVHDGYDDWFLPSIGEVKRVSNSGVYKWNTDPETQGYYWTSNGGMSGGGNAMMHKINTVQQLEYPIYGQPSNPHKVRAMREF